MVSLGPYAGEGRGGPSTQRQVLLLGQGGRSRGAGAPAGQWGVWSDWTTGARWGSERVRLERRLGWDWEALISHEEELS